MEPEVVRATPIVGQARKPKTYAEGRVCAHEDCDTRLSMYNKDKWCHHHAPRKRPRIRGRELAPPSYPKCASCAARARSLHLIDLIEEVMLDDPNVGPIVHREGFDGAATLCEGSLSSAQERAS